MTLDHLYVDNAAMQIMLRPAQFDVILTGEPVRRYFERRSSGARGIDRIDSVAEPGPPGPARALRTNSRLSSHPCGQGCGLPARRDLVGNADVARIIWPGNRITMDRNRHRSRAGARLPYRGHRGSGQPSGEGIAIHRENPPRAAERGRCGRATKFERVARFGAAHRPIICFYFANLENFEGSLSTRQPASISCRACFFSVNPAMKNPIPKSSDDIIFPK